jgi:GDPmannose 4,6-dehydratase
VQQLCETAFGAVGLDYRNYVKQEARFMRPAEEDLLVADPSKAKELLEWTPKVSFEQLIGMMVEADLARHRARG